MAKHIKAGKGSTMGKPEQLALMRQAFKFTREKIRVRGGSVWVIIMNKLHDGGQLNKIHLFSM